MKNEGTKERDKWIVDVEDAHKALLELTGHEFQRTKVIDGYVQGSIRQAINALSGVHEYMFRELRGEICTSRTLLVIDFNGNGNYKKHLNQYDNLVEEVGIAAAKIGITPLDNGVGDEIAECIGDGRQYLLDGRHMFMIVD